MYPNPEIFGITVPWYLLFHRMAVITSFIFFLAWFKYFKPFKISFYQALVLIIFLVIICYSGSRVFAGLAYLAEGGTWSELMLLMKQTEAGGYRWYGALITYILCIPLFIYTFSLVKFAKIFDLLGLTFCLFTAIVKLACLFSGDGCYGVITDLPWGMYFPYGAEPNILPVHPTPLYDSVFHLFLFGFLLRQWRHAKFHGQVGLSYLIWTSVFGILLEVIRRNPAVFLSLNFSQWCYLGILITAGWLFFKARKRGDLQLTRDFEGGILI